MEPESLLYLIQLQIHTIKLLAEQVECLRREIKELRESTQDTSVAVNAILHKISEEDYEFPPISLN